MAVRISRADRFIFMPEETWLYTPTSSGRDRFRHLSNSWLTTLRCRSVRPKSPPCPTARVRM